MEFFWEEFTEENFRKMKREVVASSNDDSMTVAHVGRVSVGDVHIELYICEEPDERFTIQQRYFVGCSGQPSDAALTNVRSEVEGFSYGEYKTDYKPFEYRTDLEYEDVVRLVEKNFQSALDRDTTGALRLAVEHSTDFWGRAEAAVREEVRRKTTAVEEPPEASLPEKIRSLSHLEPEEFKAKVLALTGTR